ncbi:MAG: EpsI family protein [Gammaproteobacteria bacterium]|nr:EpsI family protein [Gammaproteobacteria bacterium]
MNSRVKNLSGSSVAYLILAALLLLTLVLYQQTVLYLNSLWSEISIGEYAHGYLVLAISVYLVFSNRKKLKNITPRPAYSVLPLLFISVLLWLAAVLVDVEAAQTVGLLLVVLTLVWSMLGHAMIKQLAFPILFISFAIPIWFPLSPLLQDITADVVFWAARLVNVPALREENMILVPSGAFSIEEACSGLRYLLAALTLGSLYAYMNYTSLWARVGVVAMAIVTAILANFLRVFIVVYLGYVTEMQHPWVEDHLMLGWYLFGGLVAILLLFDARFYKAGKAPIEAADSKPVNIITTERVRYIYISILCACILLIGPAVIYRQELPSSSGSAIKLALPSSEAGWSEPLTDTNYWQPQYTGAIQMKSVHRVRGEDVSLFIAYYPKQKQGVEVINDLNSINNKKIWKNVYAHPRVRQLAGKETKNLVVLEQLIENNKKQRRLVWYWYNVGGQLTINKYEAKVMQLAGLLAAQPQAYMIAVSIAVTADIVQARGAMLTIIGELQGPLAKISVIDE